MPDTNDQLKLQAAIELGYLTEDQIEKIAEERKASNYPAIEVAIRFGYLSRQQLDVLEVFCNPTEVVPGYRIEGILGSGGTGTVYKAAQLRMNRSVAIKTINPDAAKNDLMPKRFEREARIVGQLRHPNIISAIDFGLHREQLYLVMEFVDGIDAEKFLEEKKRIPEELVWYMALQVCHALDSANQVGIIHRDIKPGNMILTESPQGSKIPSNVPFVKIADFGLAKFRETQREATITIENSVSGTPYYMSPEQVRATDIDHRSDIYSLGVTIWHLIEGSPPFFGTSPLDVITNKMKQEDEWLSDQPKEFSDSSFQLLKKMCRHDRDERIGDYSQLSTEIEKTIESFESLSAATQEFELEKNRFSAPARVTTVSDLQSTFSNGNEDSLDDDFQMGTLGASATAAKTMDAHGSDLLPSKSNRLIISLIATIGLASLLLLGSFVLWGNPDDDGSKIDGGENSGQARKSFARLDEFAGLPIPLFNGLEVDPTQKSSGYWDAPPPEGETGNVLAGKGGTRNFKCVDRKRMPLANFRFECGFRHNEADGVAVRAIDATGESLFEVRISPTEIVLSTKSDPKAGTQPLKQFDDTTFGYHLCRIESQPDHWRIEIDTKLIGEVQKLADESSPATIQLEAIGKGWAHFESVQLRQLK